MLPCRLRQAEFRRYPFTFLPELTCSIHFGSPDPTRNEHEAPLTRVRAIAHSATTVPLLLFPAKHPHPFTGPTDVHVTDTIWQFVLS
jgi:hypothetical protein